MLELQSAHLNWSGGEVVLSDLSDHRTAAPEAWGATPSPYQYQYQKEELSAFCHFGPNTFEGIEWGEHYGDRTPADIFRLENDFDAETLVQTLKEAGFKKLIVTAKHHDGFCIWASEYTDYDVAGSNYKNGEGDVLAEISAACTKYDMNMGLYLSPWDVHDPSYGYFDEDGNALCGGNGEPLNGMTWEQVYEQDALDYNEYYNNQLEELLGNNKYGNNGHFVEVWMDGAKGSGSKAQNYDFPTWFNTIQKYEGKAAGFEDDCLLFGAQAYTTVRWIGNELGVANEETWSKSRTNKDSNTIDSNTSGSYTVGFADGNQWTVPEADARITSGWFWGNNKKTPKTISELANMYFNSVGHNAVLLLNVPPNTDGEVDEDILNRVSEFGENVKNSFKVNLAENATVTATEVRGNDTAFSPANVLDGNDDTYWTMEDGSTTGSLTLNLGETKSFNMVTIEEAILLGQRISGFSVEYRNGDSGEWKTFAEGTTIGAKRICREMTVQADQIRINITGSHAVPLISEVGVYKSTKDFLLTSGIPEDLEVISVTDIDVSDGKGFTYTGWNAESGNQFLGGNSMYAGAGKEASLTFTGSKVWLYGTKESGHGTADIYIDGEKIESIDTRASQRKTGQMIYESHDLEHGSHVLRIVNTGTIGLDAAVVLNNGGKGMLQFETDAIEMEEDSETEVIVRRVGGSSGKVSVTYTNNPASAWQGHYDVDGIKGTLVFAEGETEKRFPVKTKRFLDKTGDLFFTVDLESVSGQAALGFNTSIKVTIRDLDDPARVDEIRQILADCKALNYELYQKEGQDAVKELTAELEAYLETEDFDVKEAIEKSNQLKAAKEQLVIRENYSEEDPFVMPSGAETKTAEAEMFILDSSNVVNANQYVRITEKAEASNGKEVNWFENGNRIYLPFVALEEGVYKVKATYRSGRGSGNPNALEWSGTNVSSGSMDVYGEENATTFHTAEFEIDIEEAGAGQLVFTASSKGGPVIDKFEFQCKEKPVVSVTGVSLNQTTLDMIDEETEYRLIATVEPENATNKNVTFTSSDRKIAIVDESGVITPKKNGRADIIVTTEDGSKTARCAVHVAIQGLALKELDEVILEMEELIQAGSGQYTQESWARFAEAYDKAANRAEDAAVEELQRLLNELQEAYGELERIELPDDPQKQALKELDDAVSGMEEIIWTGGGQYTEESWARFAEAYDKAAKRADDASVEELQRLLNELREAHEKLEQSGTPVDPQEQALTTLDNAVKSMEELFSSGDGQYTQESWARFAEAYDKAAKRADDASVEELQKLLRELQEARKELEKIELPDDPQKQALKELDDAVSGMEEIIWTGGGQYTEESWARFAEAYDKAAKRADDASVEELQRLLNELREAHEKLEQSGTPVDPQEQALTTLDNAVKSMEELFSSGSGKYTQESWAKFEEAYNKAAKRADDAGVEELQKLLKELREAREGLKKLELPADPQKKALKELDDAVKSMKELFLTGSSRYTKESFAKFKEAYNKAAKRAEDATVEELQRLLEELQTAQKGLKGNSVKVTSLKAPTGVRAVVKSAGVEITFSKVANASSYEIYRKTANKAAQKIATVKTAYYLDKNAPRGQKLTYTVVALSNLPSYKKSVASLGVSVTVPVKKETLKAVAGLKAVSKSAGVEITFSKVANASSYEIYRVAGKKAAQKIATVTDAAYLDKSAPGGKKLTYTVVALSNNPSYIKSVSSSGVSLTLPKAVSNLKVKAVSGGVKISFKKVKGAKSYTIYRSSKKNGVYKKVKTLKSKKSSYIDKKAKKGKNYYKVIAKKGKAYSPSSKVKKVKLKK